MSAARSCARCAEPAARRVQLTVPSGKVMLDQELCEGHVQMEQRTAAIGMADVRVLPLAAADLETGDAPPVVRKMQGG